MADSDQVEPKADGVDGWLKYKLLEIAGLASQTNSSLEDVKTSVEKLDDRQRAMQMSFTRTDQRLTNHVRDHPPCSVNLRKAGIRPDQVADTTKSTAGAVTWKDFFLKIVMPIGLLVSGALIGKFF